LIDFADGEAIVRPVLQVPARGAVALPPPEKTDR
jgi:hypothetical protein